MRDFYRAYESVPEVMAEAMTIGWTQNVVIMEAELTLQEKMWYIRAVRQFGWSTSAHIEKVLDGIQENTTRVRNTRAYLLASLFNAPSTMDNHYTMLVNHDLNHGG